ncbi:MAG: hypothetical protein FWC61_04280 [Proteobacteria bacterium]|nr:hypothetical protein [Pseudomonadota bacterium]
MKIFIIAGEVSGDILGAKIMQALNPTPRPCGGGGSRFCGPGGGLNKSKIQFMGVGGSEMRRAGLKSLFPISDLAVMGLAEVIARASTLTRRINETAAAIIKFHPDIVLTIDAPSFATRVIKKVKSQSPATITNHQPLFYHVVAPQVWAWGPWRAKKYAATFDRLYAFFDFEVPYFTKYGLNTIAVGHPIADGLIAGSVAPSWGGLSRRSDSEGGLGGATSEKNSNNKSSNKVAPPRLTSSATPLHRGPRATGCVAWGGHEGGDATEQTNIALIPGSRMSEVKRLLPLLRAAAELIAPPLGGGSARSAVGGAALNKSYNFYIPVVETTKKYIEQETKNWPVRPVLIPAAGRYELFARTGIAIAASGTVTAELAIMHIPTIVIYKMNPLTMFLARIMVKTKWVSLVNILLKKTVFPELLGGAANADDIVRNVRRLENPDAREKMIAKLSRADNMWQRDNQSAAELIAKDIVGK